MLAPAGFAAARDGLDDRRVTIAEARGTPGTREVDEFASAFFY